MKKVFFISVNIIPENKYFNDLTNEEVVALAKNHREDSFVYDSWESFLGDFNNENAPSDFEYYGRVIEFAETPTTISSKGSSLDDNVFVTCYRERKQYIRREAIAFFMEAMQNSEGSENERYQTIFFQLLQGKVECSDE